MMTARRPATTGRPVYYHRRFGWLRSLTDPAIDFYALAGVASPDAADLEGKLRRYLVHVVWPAYDSGAHKLDPPWLQTGAARVQGYGARETKHHKGQHSDDPGPAAEPDLIDPPLLRYMQVIDRLVTTGVLTDRHLWMLRAVWRDGMPLEKPELPKARLVRHPAAKLTDEQARAIAAGPAESERATAARYGVSRFAVRLIRSGRTYRSATGPIVDPEQTVAAQLQMSNAAVRRFWDEATTTLYFEIFDA